MNVIERILLLLSVLLGLTLLLAGEPPAKSSPQSGANVPSASTPPKR